MGETSSNASARSQAIVIPLFGEPPSDLPNYVGSLNRDGLLTVLIDNGLHSREAAFLAACRAASPCMISNWNIGGVAGGYNRGISVAIASGATVVTLLDQDSRLTSAELRQLSSRLDGHPRDRVLIGPWVVDQRRGTPIPPEGSSLVRTRMLISSGTTFRSSDWSDLGPMHEPLEVDYVDHHWCFRAASRGFSFFQDPLVVLHQVFGEPHPSRLCHLLGMQLYSPRRHYTAMRNLRWLVRQPFVPFDIKTKELLKMACKPLFWLLFEPLRGANLRAVLAGLKDRPEIPPVHDCAS